MDGQSSISLAQNISLLLAAALLFDFTGFPGKNGGSWARGVMTGAGLGLLGVVLMLTPWTMTPGLVFDTGSVLVGVSGLFFGTLPTVVTMLATGAFRLHMDGIGAWTGVGVILSSGLIGLLWRHFRKGQLAAFSWRELYAFGLTIHLAMLALMLTLPWDIALRVLAAISLPVLVIHPLGTALMGAVLVNRIRREQALERLRWSEERHRALFQAVLDPILVAEREAGIITECNAAAEAFLGRPRDHLLGLGLNALHPVGHPAHGSQTSEFTPLLAAEGMIEDVPFLCAGGEVRMVQVRASHFETQDGRFIVGVFRDVTRRKQAERALRESKLRLRTLVDAIPDLVWLKDPQGVYLGCNRAFERFFGAPETGILGKTDYDFVSRDQADFFRDMDRRAMEALEPRVNEECLTFAQGGYSGVFETIKTPMRDSEGNLVGVLGIARDITERRTAQEALEAALKKLQALWSISTLAQADLRTLCDHVLASLVDMTGSRFGFYGFISPDESAMTIHAWSGAAMQACSVVDAPLHFPITQAGVWAEAVRRREPLILNDYAAAHPDKKGCPPGHVPLTNLLVVPFLSEGRIISLAAVANRDAAYGQDDVRQITSFLTSLQATTDRVRAEKEIRENLTRMEGLINLLQRPFEDSRSFLDDALHEAIRMTSSRLGYIYRYDEAREEFTLNTWSREVMRECFVASPMTVYQLAKTGVWGEAVRQRRPIVLNDFQATHPQKKGYPEGHTPLHTFMTVPVFKEGRIVSVVGVANKDGGYTDTDILQLTLLMDAVWKVLDRHQAMRALQESEARYRNLAEGTSAIMWEYDVVHDRWSYVAPQVARVLGHPADQWTTLASWAERIHPDDRNWAVRFRETSTAKGQDHAFEYRLLKGNGEMAWLHDEAFVEMDQGQPSTVRGHLFDISAQKANEEALIRAQRAAEAASKAKSEFLANMSHEIRTPLNGLLGMIRLLEGTGLNPEQKEYCDLAIGSGRRLTSLLGDILDLSRIESRRLPIHPAPFSMENLAASLRETFAPMCREKGVPLHVLVDPAIPAALSGDEKRIRQVLFNLVGNALKFTSSGQVRMEAFRLPDQGTEFLRVLFLVSDTGTGIPDSQMGRIFEPFIQADGSSSRLYEGAGLGLSITSHLVSLLGGTLAVESSEGEGSVFAVCLPLGRCQDGIPPAQDVPPALDLPARALGILLCEDNRMNQFAMKRLLEKMGHRVEVADDGRTALDILARERFDCIVMDVLMPGMDGIQTTRNIRQGRSGVLDPQVPIVAVTANAYETDRETCLAAGMNDFLAKPVDGAQLAAALARITRGTEAGD